MWSERLVAEGFEPPIPEDTLMGMRKDVGDTDLNE